METNARSVDACHEEGKRRVGRRNVAASRKITASDNGSLLRGLAHVGALSRNAIIWPLSQQRPWRV